MLSVNTLPPVSWAWSVLSQCQHRAFSQSQHKISNQKKRQSACHNKTGNGGSQIEVCFRELHVQKSIVERLIPAVNTLGEHQHLQLDTLTPNTFLNNLLSPPPFTTQKRYFRKRSGIDMNDHDQKKHVDSIIGKMSPKESQSFTIGLKEGMTFKSASNQSKEAIPLKKLILYVGIGIVVGYLLTSGSFSIQTSQEGLFGKMHKDFSAEIPDVSFDDVKGMEEVKNELQNVVEFLKDPDRFTNLGGKLPKGILLAGPPGTGKTLLARAVAGEANVPFYFASGSEFDEVFVGVGSARIRKLFESARETAPCIIFIDEIDACGSARVSSPIHPHARQTINQLLQEMDGFSAHEGVIVLAATNMDTVLDKALTRPGRFDTEIKILPPDLSGRKAILDLYVSKIIHSDDLDLNKLARLTSGMTGAALSNLVNQAALRAAQLEKRYAEMTDFEYALDKLRLGPELKTRLRTEKELEVTAYHEAGHALVAYFTPDTMPIYKATIAQRGHALGHVSRIPTEEDETGSTKAKMLAQIDVCMGGRVAEEIFNGKDHVTTGASSDLKSATAIAYELVCSMGMSENLGFMQYSYDDASPDTKMRIEKEVNVILKSSYAKAKDLLTKHSHQHKLLAKGLLQYETLSLEEIKLLLSTQNIKSIEKLRNQQTAKKPSDVVVPSGMTGIPIAIAYENP